MASGGDVTGDLTAALTLNDAPARPSGVTATWLDTLPLEILEKVASWLDWPSLLNLKCVSAHCQDAVEFLFDRLRAVKVTFTKVTVRLCDTDGNLLACDVSLTDNAQLTELMSQLTSITELHIRKLSSKRLKALSAASRHWTRLERLKLFKWWGSSAPSSSDLALLSELCANCPLLTDVTLKDCGGGDETVKAVAVALPGLRVLHAYPNYDGSFLSELPAGLRELSVDCPELRSETVAELARFSELRSLRMEQAGELRAEHLKLGLAGCVRLERLALTYLSDMTYPIPSVIDSLPAAGLPALRHLELELCDLTNTDMGQLVERLPDLESVCLEHCQGLTRDGVAHLGRLSMLKSLKLESIPSDDSTADETLAKLSSAPLVEFQLADSRANLACITPDGLLQLTRACPTLRMVTLQSYTSDTVWQVECGPGIDERSLLQRFKNSLAELQASDSDSDSDSDFGVY